MSHPATVIAIADQLTPGQKRRVEHDCGDGNTMIVSRNARGISYWCHRCHTKGWLPTERSLAERIAALREATEWDGTAQQSLELPGPGKFDPQDWPDQPRVWLYKAGFSNDEIRRHGWYWNPRMERVILPVKVDGKTIYWQGRGFDSSRPKAINVRVDKANITARYGDGPVVAITEDMLSAAKVGGVTEAHALLGTVVSDAVLLRLASAGKPIALMLDSDAAGRAGAKAIALRLSLLGVDNRQIYFGRDPKLVARKDIKNEIEAHWPGCFGPLQV